MLLEFVLLVSQHLQILVELVHLVQAWASQLQEEAHVYMKTCLLILNLYHIMVGWFIPVAPTWSTGHP
jgi:hypothetical protein